MKKRNKQKLMKDLDKLWSEYVRERDKNCQKCGGSGSVSAHHAFGRRHLAVRWDIYNGVALCYPCHIHWAHRDPAGFAEWFRVFVGDAQYERLSEAHNQIFKPTVEDLERNISFFKETKEALC